MNPEIEWGKSERDREISYDITYMWNIKKDTNELQYMGSQRVGHDWATELNWNELVYKTEKELQMEKANLCLPGCKGMERVNWENDWYIHTTIYLIDN